MNSYPCPQSAATVRGITPDHMSSLKPSTSERPRSMRYKATITTMCDEHKLHTVTISGDGEQVWGAADSAIRTLETNGAKPEIHFYQDGNEVDWVATLNEINLRWLLFDALQAANKDQPPTDLPF